MIPLVTTKSRQKPNWRTSQASGPTGCPSTQPRSWNLVGPRHHRQCCEDSFLPFSWNPLRPRAGGMGPGGFSRVVQGLPGFVLPEVCGLLEEGGALECSGSHSTVLP